MNFTAQLLNVIWSFEFRSSVAPMQRERPSDVFCDEPTRGVLDHTDGVDDGVD
jgi:hypothetical protein